jgi:hypothetical protein
MKRNNFLLCAAALSLFNAVGCDSSNNKPSPTNTAKSDPTEAKSDASVPLKSDANSEPKTAKAEPDYITVQHCLIGFKGSLPGKPVTRTKDEAKELATKLLAELKAGADFDEIIRKNTDDSPPGIYKMANRGKKADMSQEVYPREGMVPAFGDTGFPLEVGEFGLAEYDTQKSPFGWHIVKRTK